MDENLIETPAEQPEETPVEIPAEEPAAEPAAESEPTGPDYMQLLYEYTVARDALEEEYREEELALYSGKLDELNMQLTEIRTELAVIVTKMDGMQESLEWSQAFLMILVVLKLFDKARSWVRILSGEGGKKNVY